MSKAVDGDADVETKLKGTKWILSSEIEKTLSSHSDKHTVKDENDDVEVEIQITLDSQLCYEYGSGLVTSFLKVQKNFVRENLQNLRKNKLEMKRRDLMMKLLLWRLVYYNTDVLPQINMAKLNKSFSYCKKFRLKK